jgi:ATP-dependent DNA helicase RecQ
MAGIAEPADFIAECLSIDLEVGKADQRIHHFAAVRGDTGEAFSFSGGDLAGALRRLDQFARGARFLVGHNLTAFDRPHLAAVNPSLRLLRLPDVDTLRLNPLAFPRNPYHHLVKHYQDGQLIRGQLNDPKLDAQLTLEVLANQLEAFRVARASQPDLVAAWHWLTTRAKGSKGLDRLFAGVRGRGAPSRRHARAVIHTLLDSRACVSAAQEVAAGAEQQDWPLAYVLAWLSVAGGNSVIPPWVRRAFPAVTELVHRLRERPCNNRDCDWCRTRHDAVHELKRWFGFDAFRPAPANEEGTSLQQVIVEDALQGRHTLGILPTGTGKSVCYQVPALSRFDKTGALTIVISPLVALMADQVAGMEARGYTSCAAVNGLLSAPERADVLDRVRLGDIGIVIISPEQLRSKSVRRALNQREIAGWVLDEAHCLSKWGHDFRPDYRYVARCIRKHAGEGKVPPILCLTATAKQDVVTELRDYFADKLGIELQVVDGGASRSNLSFAILSISQAEKLDCIHNLLETDLPPGVAGGAIVYRSSRQRAEETAEFLKTKGIEADYFHAKVPVEAKKEVQRRFVEGELRVIAATNAFGMGIDKPDVRLVVHGDLPGSLENYLQEAGRAGRDQAPARCVLLYAPEDVEWQFGLSARSRLSRREIAAILRALRRLESKRRRDGEVVATAGEVLLEEDSNQFERDSATDDTRVRTAIAWLEESALLQRDENQTQVFPSSLRVSSVDEAREKLARRQMVDSYRAALLKIVHTLITADPDEGISTDELMGISGLTSAQLRKAMADLETLGIASNDLVLTAYVHTGVERSSAKRLEETNALEADLIAMLQEEAPDLSVGESSTLHLRLATQRLKDRGHPDVLPEKVWRLVRSIAGDGREGDEGKGSIDVRRVDAECSVVTLGRPWAALAELAQRRRSAGQLLLEHLVSCLPPRARGLDLLAETTLGKLRSALAEDLVLRQQSRSLDKLLDRALLWLHEQQVIRLNKGLAVFRPAMTIHLASDRQRTFTKADFQPLELHYNEQVVQIHVMAEFVQRGVVAMGEALQLAMDYFALDRSAFVARWLVNRERELRRQTTPASWRKIVEALRNPVQQAIVADDREQTNVLVLAGPGSGKTRVLVHRLAYLIRVRRENPRGILALAYNRHAAVEIRQRLRALIGDDAIGISVMTCHALAMRLTGVSFARRADLNEQSFDEVLAQATALLRGHELPPDEADEQRARLLGGFRWILVDEYQDVGEQEYELISALAGRSLEDADSRLALFAVGDDDQNIYDFRGASVEYIRRFESDYEARASYLVENYRSTPHIIDAANQLIALAPDRMKVEHPIVVNHARESMPAGGDWESLDPVGRGRVQVLDVGGDLGMQGVAMVQELERLSGLSSNFDWTRSAVIASEWKHLHPVRAYCEWRGIPVHWAKDEIPHFWRLRETQTLIEWLKEPECKVLRASDVIGWLEAQVANTWFDMLREAAGEYADETRNAELPVEHCLEWLAEYGQQVRRRQKGLLLVTAHGAKGLEFDHVGVLDGGWARGSAANADSMRRLFYVAMTRARQTLLLADAGVGNPFLSDLGECGAVTRRGPIGVGEAVPASVIRRVYCSLTLRDVDIGFAGRRMRSEAIHGAIGRLSVGDALSLGQTGEIQDDSGGVVGRLAKGYAPPAGASDLISARVAAIVRRRESDGDPTYAALARCDGWEVVVPEFVYGVQRETVC